MGREALSYIKEFRLGWPALLASAIGLSLGVALNHYILNLLGPAMIAEFGWQKSQFALVGSLSLFSMLFVPFMGRFADRFGARPSIAIGFAGVALIFLALSLMTGSIWHFYGLTILKNIIGILTTTLVFTRVVVERFDAARGISLAMLMSGAPLIGATLVPIIGGIIDAEGWRMGYRVMAMLSAFGGLVAFTVIRPQRKAAAENGGNPAPAAARLSTRMSRADFLMLVRRPAFLLLIGGMLLVNFPQIIVSSQLKLVAMESGATSVFATWLVSLYAISVVIGRFLSGIALDHFPVHLVAVATLGLPAIGLVGMASPYDAQWVLFCAVALIGLAQGAEGDVGAYLTSRRFDMAHYSFIFSFVIAAIGIGSAVGSLVLGLVLHLTDRFTVFLLLSAILTVLGAVSFYLTGRFDTADHEPSRLKT